MLFNIKTLFVLIALVVIVAEARPRATPQEPDEFILEDLPPLDDDTPIDADSFPLAHDVPQGVGGVDDYHIRK